MLATGHVLDPATGEDQNTAVITLLVMLDDAMRIQASSVVNLETVFALE